MNPFQGERGPDFGYLLSITLLLRMPSAQHTALGLHTLNATLNPAVDHFGPMRSSGPDNGLVRTVAW